MKNCNYDRKHRVDKAVQLKYWSIVDIPFTFQQNPQKCESYVFNKINHTKFVIQMLGIVKKPISQNISPFVSNHFFSDRKTYADFSSVNEYFQIECSKHHLELGKWWRVGAKRMSTKPVGMRPPALHSHPNFPVKQTLKR